MKWLKYKGGIVAFFCLALTGAFSLFEMRYAVSQQALRMKVLERELLGLQDTDKRLDVFLVQWWHKQQSLQGDTSSRRMLWMAKQDRFWVPTMLAYHSVLAYHR